MSQVVETQVLDCVKGPFLKKHIQRVAIFGATGSIGGSTLDVIDRHPDRFEVFAVSAHRDVASLVAICAKFQPAFAIIADARLESELRSQLSEAGCRAVALAGNAALDVIAVHDEVDTVLAAIVGAAGLSSTLAAARAGKRLLLANKEAVVMSGQILMSILRQSGAQLLPIDSEHNAILQCMTSANAAQFALANGDGAPCNHTAENLGIERVILTASGGPFRGRTRQNLHTVTPTQAVAHPNWKMGRKISVDSATLANKGLEVIEAKWLFDLKPEQIAVLVHPQSLVHALVQYRDGSTLAQLGLPDMRTAIANALAWPERIDAGVAHLDLTQTASLQFEEPDTDTFRALRLARSAMIAGGTAPAIFNAANEVAVESFLNEALGFLQIAELIEHVLNTLQATSADTLPLILDADHRARACARAALSNPVFQVNNA